MKVFLAFLVVALAVALVLFMVLRPKVTDGTYVYEEEKAPNGSIAAVWLHAIEIHDGSLTVTEGMQSIIAHETFYDSQETEKNLKMEPIEGGKYQAVANFEDGSGSMTYVLEAGYFGELTVLGTLRSNDGDPDSNTVWHMKKSDSIPQSYQPK